MRAVPWGGWFCHKGFASLPVLLLTVICSAPKEGRAQIAQTRPAARQMLRLADLPEVKVFNELAASPDGRWVAYTMSRPFPGGRKSGGGQIIILDIHRNSKRVVDLAGEPRGLVWSPVGSRLAFIIPASDAGRIWVYSPADQSGKARLLNATDTLRQDIQAIGWSPSGTEIGYLAKDPPRRPTESATPPRIVIFRDEPGEITGSTSGYGLDSAGLYLAVASIEGKSARVLARDLVTTQGWPPTIDWSRSGKILIGGGPLGGAYPRLLSERRLYLVDTSTGQAQQIAPDYPGRFRAALSPSGHSLAYLEFEFLPERPRIPGLFSLRLARIGLSGSIIDTSNQREIDGLISTLPPVWADDKTLYVGRYVDGTARLYAVDLTSRRWRQITPDTLSVSAYSTVSNGKLLLAILENVNQQQELYRVDPRARTLTRLTNEAATQPALRLGNIEQIEWLSADSRFTVHGFLVKPPGYDPRRRYPLIVMIHGGPGASYLNHFRDINFGHGAPPPQMIAAAGYLVMLPNPRGDWSYGLAYRNAVYEDYGPGPFADVMGGVSALIYRGLVDSAAVGVYGGSYGAYLTAYAITQTRRFAAAAINDGPMDLASFYGQNYAINSHVLKHFMGGTPWTQAARYRSQSPITHVDRVRTPVLMRYGGRSMTDDNVRPSYMLSQGLEFYAALRDHDIPVEFIVHPDQGHGVADWELFQDYCQRILGWFGKWLPQNNTDLPENTP